jgi:hypothetical protein
MVPVLCVIVLFRPVWSVDEKAGRHMTEASQQPPLLLMIPARP